MNLSTKAINSSNRLALFTKKLTTTSLTPLLHSFFALWALFVPITSVVISPAVPGSVPAYLFAFASLPFALLVCPKKAGRLLLATGMVLIPFIILSALAQFNLQFYWRLDLGELVLVNLDDQTLLLRPSLFTQTLYLLPGILTFAFVQTFYQPTWNKFIFLGAFLLACYGFYEVGYYLITRQNGDFLSNRVFDNGTGEASGSLFQLISIGGYVIMRLKSLTGEPSMYAFSILPYWIYAVHQRKTLLHLTLLVSLLLTTATTALFGIGIYLVCRFFFLRLSKRFVSGYADKLLTSFLVTLLLGLVLAFPVISSFVQETLAKLSASSVSGVERLGSFQGSLNFFAAAPLGVQLFGVGFGYIRSTDFFTTLLVNTGVLGLALFSFLFFYPIFKLPKTYEAVGLKSALIVIFITMMVAVPEFAYSSIWLFLGLSYHTLRQEQIKREQVRKDDAPRLH
jgi:hypothetical protein